MLPAHLAMWQRRLWKRAATVTRIQLFAYAIGQGARLFVRQFYVDLDTATESLTRIENRVKRGGHNIPPMTMLCAGSPVAGRLSPRCYPTATGHLRFLPRLYQLVRLLVRNSLRSMLEAKAFFAGYLHRQSRWFPKSMTAPAPRLILEPEYFIRCQNLHLPLNDRFLRGFCESDF